MEPEPLEARFLRGEPEAVGTVSRWISTVLTDLRFFGLQGEWPDLHQAAMADTIASLRSGRFDPARDFRAYVTALARFKIREASRRKRKRLERAVDMPESFERAPRSSTESILIRTLLARQVLARLPEPCRALVVAYFLEDRDADTIAAELGIPVGTVKSRLFRCLQTAREKFDARRDELLLSAGDDRRTRSADSSKRRRAGRRREVES